jgi:hypothetical protein
MKKRVINSMGFAGIQTCDMVVDSTGTAVDCSLWSNFFSGACWNPLAPCAAIGAVSGQAATVDQSLSQLGPVVASVVESTPPGSPSVDFCSAATGISCTIWLIGGAALAAFFIFGGRR